jgi:hypothetical protein
VDPASDVIGPPVKRREDGALDAGPGHAMDYRKFGLGTVSGHRGKGILVWAQRRGNTRSCFWRKEDRRTQGRIGLVA